MLVINYANDPNSGIPCKIYEDIFGLSYVCLQKMADNTVLLSVTKAYACLHFLENVKLQPHIARDRNFASVVTRRTLYFQIFKIMNIFVLMHCTVYTR